MSFIAGNANRGCFRWLRRLEVKWAGDDAGMGWSAASGSLSEPRAAASIRDHLGFIPLLLLNASAIARKGVESLVATSSKEKSLKLPSDRSSRFAVAVSVFKVPKLPLQTSKSVKLNCVKSLGSRFCQLAPTHWSTATNDSLQPYWLKTATAKSACQTSQIDFRQTDTIENSKFLGLVCLIR